MKEVNPAMANKPALKIKGRTFVGAAALVVSSISQAAIDVSDTVGAIGDAQGPVTEIGTAVLAVLVCVAVFKWVRRAF